MTKHPKRPRDPNQLAKLITDIATGEAEDEAPARVEAAERARRGGEARRKSLTGEQRKEIALVAALARWKKDD